MSERFSWDFKLTNTLECLDKYEVVPTEDYKKYLRPNLDWIAKAYMDILVVGGKETMTIDELAMGIDKELLLLFKHEKLPYKVIAGVLGEISAALYLS